MPHVFCVQWVCGGGGVAATKKNAGGSTGAFFTSQLTVSSGVRIPVQSQDVIFAVVILSRGNRERVSRRTLDESRRAAGVLNLRRGKNLKS